MNSLANALVKLGKLEEAGGAEELLETLHRTLGREHHRSLNTMHNLALVLSYQGKNHEAQRIYEDVVELKRKILGSEHPDTLKSKHNLAHTMAQQGNHREAYELAREVLDLQRRT